MQPYLTGLTGGYMLTWRDLSAEVYYLTRPVGWNVSDADANEDESWQWNLARRSSWKFLAAFGRTIDGSRNQKETDHLVSCCQASLDLTTASEKL